MTSWRALGLCGAVALSWALGACSSTPAMDTPDGGAGDMTTPDPGPGDPYVSTAVLAAAQTASPGQRGRTFDFSTDNALMAGWLLHTAPTALIDRPYASLPIPPACSGAACDSDFGLTRCSSDADCLGGARCAEVAATVKAPGQAPQRLCVGPSDLIYEEMYKVLTSAERFADVTSLLPPDGAFEAAIRNAITLLGASGRDASVRLVFGCYPVQGVVDAQAVLGRVTRDLPAGAKLRVAVGNYRSSNLPPSWNHSKIVAADGKTAIVGGHNLWGSHYLGKNPVNDVSIRVSGSAAAAAHRFADEQWRYTCDARTVITRQTWSVRLFSLSAGKVTEDCPTSFADAKVPATTGTGNTPVVALGRLAQIDSTGKSNPSDAGLQAAIGAAKRTVRISQQDLGPPLVPILGIPASDWPDALLLQLGAALVRGVDVYIMVSNKGSIAGGLSATDASYSNGWTPEDLARRVRDVIVASPPVGAPTGAALTKLLCEKLHVAPLRWLQEDTFPDGTPLPNHAKLLMVDDQAFYVGSQNLYNAGLTEFGFLVDDRRAGAQMLSGYYAPLWERSRRVAVTGSDAPVCIF